VAIKKEPAQPNSPSPGSAPQAATPNIILRGGDVTPNIAGMAWPAIPDQRTASVLSLLYQMERSERWPAQRIRLYQFRQMTVLLRHAGRHVPFYRERFKRLASMLTRRSRLNLGGKFHCSPVPTFRRISPPCNPRRCPKRMAR